MTRFISVLALVLCAGAAMAEDLTITARQGSSPITKGGATSSAIIMTIAKDGTITADWNAIRRCAEASMPGFSMKDMSSYRIAEMCFKIISSCRTMINARHVGWVEAGGDKQDEQHRPTPNMLENDLKEPLPHDSKEIEIKCYKDNVQ